MIDVALVPTGEVLDLALEAGDLKLENGLLTAVLVSLFSDGLAAADDELPDGGTERRGWWGAEVLDQDRGQGHGSLLWLLERSVLTNETLARAEEYARDALAWLVRARIAQRVTASAQRLDTTTALLSVEIMRGDATERADLWAAQLSASLDVGPTRFVLVAVP